MRSLKRLIRRWLVSIVSNGIFKDFTHPEIQRLCVFLSELEPTQMYAIGVDDCVVVLYNSGLSVFLESAGICEKYDIPLVAHIPDVYTCQVPVGLKAYMYLATAIRTLRKIKLDHFQILQGEGYGYIWFIGENIITFKKVTSDGSS